MVDLNLDAEALSRGWSLSLDELALVEALEPEARLGYVAQLKFYQQTGRCPDHGTEITIVDTAYLAHQVEAEATALSEPSWADWMRPEDWRGLTPLIYAHINPYCRFDPDLNRRIDFELREAA